MYVIVLFRITLRMNTFTLFSIFYFVIDRESASDLFDKSNDLYSVYYFNFFFNKYCNTALQ